MAGPGSNLTGHRNYNTTINSRSRNGGGLGGPLPKLPASYTPYGANPTPPVLPPNSYGAYAAQIMGLQQSLAAAAALQRANIGAARSTYLLAQNQARALQIGETASAEQSALQSGILGSSADLANRAQAITDAATARQEALAARGAAIASARTGMLGAIGQYYGGLGQVQAAQANEAATLANQRYQNDLFDVLNQNFNKLRTQVLRRLQRGRARDINPGIPIVRPGYPGGSYLAPTSTNPGYGPGVRGGRI